MKPDFRLPTTPLIAAAIASVLMLSPALAQTAPDGQAPAPLQIDAAPAVGESGGKDMKTAPPRTIRAGGSGCNRKKNLSS